MLVTAAMRTTRCAAVVVVTLHTSGCYTRRTVPIAPVPPPDPVVVVVDGRSVRLHAPRIEGDSVLAGWERRSPVDSTEVRIPLFRDVRKLDVTRTVLLAAGVTLAAATAALVYLVKAMTSW